MALIPSQILRVAILLSYFSILCHYKALDMPAHQTYGGSWKFLTFIDLVIQAVFFGVCVLIDVSSLLTKGGDSREQERQLRKLIGLRDWMMAVLAFPVGAFVVFTFWTLYLYDRELVYPRLLDNFIPQWLNHGMDVLGAPGDRCVGVPGAGAHHSAGSSHLLQCDDRGDLCFLHPRRNPQQLHLGPATHRKGQR
ncbi:androgen-induced gene 1 protein isoform X2 [Siniperca chuatsi]|uniref:androgen-induced gene 1 protein isoform X2 n=1 Tax=Siniperca chuatsi TaxID=119488 RepID=UPI001CE080F7|nr:androgen-induced gene 1 protein isoform X2 [Siniperca chuatsi]